MEKNGNNGKMRIVDRKEPKPPSRWHEHQAQRAIDAAIFPVALAWRGFVAWPALYGLAVYAGQPAPGYLAACGVVCVAMLLRLATGR